MQRRWQASILTAAAVLLTAACAAAGTVRVACVGDSITFGAGIRDRREHVSHVEREVGIDVFELEDVLAWLRAGECLDPALLQVLGHPVTARWQVHEPVIAPVIGDL